MEIVAADIGGTHARFSIAEVADGRVVNLGPDTTLRTAEHASFETAWEAFADHAGRTLPPRAGIAIAGPVDGEVLRFTNNPWVIRPGDLPKRLGLDHLTIVNDFGAVAHAAAQLGPENYRHICGPDKTFPTKGIITIIGPGTGLGVAQVLRLDGDHYHAIETEGGHIDYAPLDGIEDGILRHLRERYRRVSIERVVSGPGLVNIHEALAKIEGRAIQVGDDKALWAAALDGSDSLAVAALERFCLSFGSVAGDVALAQGGVGVVIAGGIGLRLAEHLPKSGFKQRFVAKGRFEARMGKIPVKLITHPQPGLFGAAAAAARAL
jgi:glucokinase